MLLTPVFLFGSVVDLELEIEQDKVLPASHPRTEPIARPRAPFFALAQLRAEAIHSRQIPN